MSQLIFLMLEFKYFHELLVNVLQVYIYLLKMYLQPPDMSMFGMAPGNAVTTKPNVPAALKLLEDHAHKIDVAKVRIVP